MITVFLYRSPDSLFLSHETVGDGQPVKDWLCDRISDSLLYTITAINGKFPSLVHLINDAPANGLKIRRVHRVRDCD